MTRSLALSPPSFYSIDINSLADGLREEGVWSLCFVTDRVGTSELDDISDDCFLTIFPINNYLNLFAMVIFSRTILIKKNLIFKGLLGCMSLDENGNENGK